MAKKKKKKSKHHKKHHKVNGLDAMLMLSVVAGVVGGELLNKGVKMIPGTETLNPYIVPGGKVISGIVMPFLSKDGKTKQLLTGFGAGFVSSGLLDIGKETGILSGDDLDTDDLIVDLTPGAMNADVLAGIQDLGVMNANVLANDDLGVMNGMH